jgi:hypothetical protein
MCTSNVFWSLDSAALFIILLIFPIAFCHKCTIFLCVLIFFIYIIIIDINLCVEMSNPNTNQAKEQGHDTKHLWNYVTKHILWEVTFVEDFRKSS